MRNASKEEEITILVAEFNLDSDLCKLAQASELIKEFLKENEFPTAKYIKWLKQNK